MLFLSPDAPPPSAAGSAGSAGAAAGAPAVSSGGTVTAANWRKMQLVGCVFLPCAGLIGINASSVTLSGERIYYWTSYSSGGQYATPINLTFGDTYVAVPSSSIQTKQARCSIRLVKSL